MLRILTWNIHSASKAGEKFDMARAEGCDVIVFQEAPAPQVMAAQGASMSGFDVFYDELVPGKGVLVAVRETLKAERHGPPRPDLVLFNAIHLPLMGIPLLACHCDNHRANLKRPEATRTPFPEALTAYGEWLGNGSGIVMGDFNNDARIKAALAANRFDRLLARLDGLGMTSVSHHAIGEAFGAETQPTFWAGNGRNHIDYAFVGGDLLPKSTLHLEPDNTWRDRSRSDHAPLIVDVAV